MSITEPCLLFAGPSLRTPTGRTVPVPESITLRPPVARGDIDALVRKSPVAGTLVLADGVFHQSLAVSHAEIRDALQAGWRVWGLSSMGAIRAYEMRSLGMRGFGRVYEMFLSEEDFQDDEVALIHEADPPYRCLSEPLVHLRIALREWEAAGRLSSSARVEIESRLKSMWYGDRSLSGFEAILQSHMGESLEDALADFDRYRAKTTDLADFLELGLWR